MILVPSLKLTAAHQLASLALAGGTPTLFLAVLITGLVTRALAAFVPVLAIHARYRGAQTAVVLLSLGLVRPHINERKMRHELNAAVIGAQRAALLK